MPHLHKNTGRYFAEFQRNKNILEHIHQDILVVSISYKPNVLDLSS